MFQPLHTGWAITSNDPFTLYISDELRIELTRRMQLSEIYADGRIINYHYNTPNLTWMYSVDTNTTAEIVAFHGRWGLCDEEMLNISLCEDVARFRHHITDTTRAWCLLYLYGEMSKGVFEMLVRNDYINRNNADYLKHRDELHTALLDYIVFSENPLRITISN